MGAATGSNASPWTAYLVSALLALFLAPGVAAATAQTVEEPLRFPDPCSRPCTGVALVAGEMGNGPCITRLNRGLNCGVAFTAKEFKGLVCRVSAAGECVVFRNDVYRMANDHWGLCKSRAGVPEWLRADHCQAVKAARLTLAHQILYCPPHDTPALHPAWDVPVCILRP